MDKVRDVRVHGSADSGSTLSVPMMDGKGSFEKSVLKTNERGLDSREEDEEKADAEEGDEDYIDPFVRWASRGMWHHLLYCLCPIEISEWSDLSTPVKLLQIIQAPIFILFRLTIPVVYEDLEPTPSSASETATEAIVDEGLTVFSSAHVDEGSDEQMVTETPRNLSRTANERSEETRSCVDSSLVDFEDLHGWCRLLNCFQCLITPMLWVLLITGERLLKFFSHLTQSYFFHLLDSLLYHRSSVILLFAHNFT